VPLCESSAASSCSTIVRSVRFGDATPNRPDNQPGEFELKQQIAQLFEFIRSVDGGEIRILEARGGLPFNGIREQPSSVNSMCPKINRLGYGRIEGGRHIPEQTF
jgi:hypothetical protein